VNVTVVMPRSAARVKVEQCRRLGADVLLHGETFEQAGGRAAELALERRIPNIHPFDDPAVIAGQGTVALEILDQLSGFDAVVVPVGGGGLLAGVALAIRALRPDVSVIGVEPECAPCFSKALAYGEPFQVSTQSTLADGLAVAQAGLCAFQIAAPLVNKVVTVNEESLAAAIRCLAELEGAVVEGAGAAPLAALLSGRLPECKGKRVVLLLTGRNIDPAAHQTALLKSIKNEQVNSFSRARPPVPHSRAGFSEPKPLDRFQA
jgi:threonine dehydratase